MRVLWSHNFDPTIPVAGVCMYTTQHVPVIWRHVAPTQELRQSCGVVLLSPCHDFLLRGGASRTDDAADNPPCAIAAVR
jgi:hypothetical protein